MRSQERRTTRLFGDDREDKAVAAPSRPIAVAARPKAVYWMVNASLLVG